MVGDKKDEKPERSKVAEQVSRSFSKALKIQLKQLDIIIPLASTLAIPFTVILIVAVTTERFFPATSKFIIEQASKTFDFGKSNIVELSIGLSVIAGLIFTSSTLFNQELKARQRASAISSREAARQAREMSDLIARYAVPRYDTPSQEGSFGEAKPRPATSTPNLSPAPSFTRIIRPRKAPIPESYLDIYSQFTRRMSEDASRLKRNSGINLFWGIIFSLIAVAFLLATIYYRKDVQISSTQQFIELYGPKATLAVILELISFFFLRLHSSTEQEIKHHKNEVTNMESKFAAAMLMLESPSATTRAQVIKGLMDNERNFIIRKNERTVSSEIISNYNDFSNFIAEAVRAAKGVKRQK